MGNAWQRDDGAGLAAARRLRDRVPAGVRVHELDGEPVGLLDVLEGAGRAYVVDAIRSGAEPGAVIRADALAEPLPAAFSAASTHLLGVGTAVELGRTLGRLPPRLVLFGVEGARFDAGDELTPAVAAGVEEVVRRLLAEL